MAGQSPIKVSEVESYLNIHGEDCIDRRTRLLRLVIEMDTTFLEHLAKKASA